MPRRIIVALKLCAHLICLAPLIWLVRFCTSPRVFLNADPVKFIIHFTGDWAIYILLAWLSISFLRKLTERGSWPIQFYGLTGAYALFYATLHLLMYVCIYSGYDFIGAFAGFHTGHARALLIEWNAVFPGVLDDFRKRPFIDFGLFAWALLLVGAVTLQGFLQRASGGKQRQHLYRLMYVAVIAAVIHFWWFVAGNVPTSGGPCIDVFRTASVTSESGMPGAITWKLELARPGPPKTSRHGK